MLYSNAYQTDNFRNNDGLDAPLAKPAPLFRTMRSSLPTPIFMSAYCELFMRTLGWILRFRVGRFGAKLVRVGRSGPTIGPKTHHSLPKLAG